MMLSISQRCSDQRRTWGEPGVPASIGGIKAVGENSFMAIHPCGDFAGTLSEKCHGGKCRWPLRHRRGCRDDGTRSHPHDIDGSVGPPIR
jgi:hypothetical protein